MTFFRSGATMMLSGAALALMLGGCAAERFNFAGFTGKPQPQQAAYQAPVAQAPAGGGYASYGAPVQGGVQPVPASYAAPVQNVGPAQNLSPAQTVAMAPAASLSATPAPTGRVTDAPVGGGVNVQPGSNEDFIVNVGRRVFFTEGSAQLTNIARATLDNQAAWLKRFPTWSAKIQGFADDPGADAANTALSQQRADAVMAYLTSKGVPASRLRAKAYGREKQRIVRACDDAACKAQNRRVITNIERR